MCVLSCPTHWDPVDYSPPDSSGYGIFQARILQWVAISFSRDLPDQKPNPCLLSLLHCRWILYLLSYWGSPKHRGITAIRRLACSREWLPTPVFLPGENSMDRGARWATVHGVAESDMTEQLTLSLFFISLSISQYINRKDGECFLIWQVSYMAVIYENSHCTSEYSYKHPLFACTRTVFLSLCAMEPRWFCWGHSGVIIKSWQQVWVSPAFFSIGAALLSILHIWLL